MPLREPGETGPCLGALCCSHRLERARELRQHVRAIEHTSIMSHFSRELCRLAPVDDAVAAHAVYEALDPREQDGGRLPSSDLLDQDLGPPSCVSSGLRVHWPDGKRCQLAQEARRRLDGRLGLAHNLPLGEMHEIVLRTKHPTHLVLCRSVCRYEARDHVGSAEVVLDQLRAHLSANPCVHRARCEPPRHTRTETGAPG
mmetsp:Transcript_17960/g.50043  ORF Transcript_17960/g.50043 Transcript_17960/m.50043 type:complete len:200 (-) Transcript_17960:542-1141(-)